MSTHMTVKIKMLQREVLLTPFLHEPTLPCFSFFLFVIVIAVVIVIVLSVDSPLLLTSFQTSQTCSVIF